jgi:hypothetical protein
MSASTPQFALNKQVSTCIRFDLNPASIGQIEHSVRVKNGSIPVSYRPLSFPLYLAEELPRILEEIRTSDSDLSSNGSPHCLHG